MTTGERWHP
uniref:Uncharacterized protein n=1 Tax=Anguilla anguilla TaxID=7936 RepID=A0A0E9VZK8_ANGAN